MWEVAALALGEAAGPLLKKAAERHVERFFGDRIDDLAKRGKKKPLVQAMEHAWNECLDLILREVQYLGDFEDDDPDFRAYFEPLKRYVDQDVVGSELLKPVLEVDSKAPDPNEMRFGWEYLDDAPSMPEGFSWSRIASRYRKALTTQRILSADLRPQLDSQNLEKALELLEGQVGVLPEANEARYAERMREKYRVMDLSDMLPQTAEDDGPILLRHAFVPQKVRENPPPVELPRDLLHRLAKEGSLAEEAEDERTAWQIERIRESYSQSPAEPVLDVVTAPANRRLVLIGGPGSGKSTLTRYLLLSALDPARGDERPPWLRALSGHLPLLVELREFIAVYEEKRCENFLEYWHYLGKTQKDHLDQKWIHERLRSGPSLVLLDGLDEIFDARDRERVMHAIVGFAGEYPQARVVVTSRPVGYRDAILNAGGFSHYALEDLDDEQIKKFVDGWFGHLFPDSPKDAEQRRQRILGATEKSRSVRLLAGNPMLLTIMALIAQLRELPRERWRFYDHAAEVLCHHWDVNRHLEAEGVAEYIGLEDKKELLERIAVHMQEGESGLAGNVVREGELSKVTEGYLAQRYGLGKDKTKPVAGRLIEQLRERNYVLCLRGPRLYGFVHRTFLEYFSATALVRRLRDDPDCSAEQLRDDVVVKHLGDESWREVLRLVVGMIGERQASIVIRYLVRLAYPMGRSSRRGMPTEEQLEAIGEPQPPRDLLLSQPDPLLNLALAIECLAEVRNLQALRQECVCFLQALLENIRTVDEYRSYKLEYILNERIIPAAEEFQIPRGLENWFTAEANRVFSDLKIQLLKPLVALLSTVWVTDAEELAKRAEYSEDEHIRSTAIKALARDWPNRKGTRELMIQRITEDPEHSARSAAIQALAKMWPSHEDTRRLISERATEDGHFLTRAVALETLAREWPDCQNTRSLVAERAIQDKHSLTRGAALGILAELLLDPRAMVLLSKYLSGRSPFLDPLEAVPERNLRRGAGILQISTKEARDLLAACEPVLGWNPLEGSRI